MQWLLELFRDSLISRRRNRRRKMVRSCPALHITTLEERRVLDAAVTVEDVTAVEGVGLAFTVTLDNAVDGGTKVTVTLADVTATGGVAPLVTPEDYDNVVAELTFAGTAGETQQFTVATLDDAVREGAETFTVQLNASNPLVTATDTATGTITDNDTAAVTVEDVTAIEGVGLVFTVTLDNAVQGGTSVTVTLADVTATGGAAPLVTPEDFNNVVAVLTFAGTAGETQQFMVATLDDAVLEEPETFTVQLSASNPLVTDTDTATGTITDNDTATLTIDNATVAEGGGLVFTVTLSAAVQGVVFVDFATADGTATTADGDYTAASGKLKFSGTAGEQQTITVATTTDTKVEPDEILTVTLSNVTAGKVTVVGGPATGTITNDDTATLTIDNVSVVEGGNLVFTVTLSAAVQGGVTVDFATADGTATTADGDYTANSGTLTFAGTAGEQQTITVATTADTTVEPDETLTVTLSSVTAANVTVEDDPATGTISNDDTATLTIGNVSVVEGVGLVFTVTLDNAVQDGTDVNVTLADVTATGGAASLATPEDYDNAVAVLSFAGTLGERQQFTVATLDDALLEGTETFTVNLDALNPLVTDTDTATGTITDNENAMLSIAATSTVTEGGGVQAAGEVTLTITGTGAGTFALGKGVVVSAGVTQTGGTATLGTDYAAFGIQTVTFDGGAVDGTVASGAVASATLNVTNDRLLEDLETVLLTLGNASGPATSLGDTANATTIADNESATLSIAATSTVTEEGDAQAVGVVTLTITGTGAGALALGQGVVVSAEVTQTGGTATLGTDYAAFGIQKVTFDGGAVDGTVATGATQNAALTAVEDVLLEGSETVDLTLGNLVKPTEVAASLGETANVTTITDNESATLSIASLSPVTEAGGVQAVGLVTLTILGTGSGTFALGRGVVVSADVTQTGGTATSGTDYTAFGIQTVTFAGGELDGTVATGATQSASLTAVEDALLEGSETVDLTLGNLVKQTSVAASLGETANVTTITDNESATLSIAATSTVTEGGGVQAVGEVTLTITGTGAGTFALGQGVVVSAGVTQTGGTATLGTDYAAFGIEAVTFEGGAVDGTVATGAVASATLNVTNDRLLEDPETVLLMLGNVSGPATTLGDTANTTTITDNESATLSIVTTSTVTEAGGVQAVGLVTLTITGTGAGALALGQGVVVSAEVTQTGGTATSGADYAVFGVQTAMFDGGVTDGTVTTGAVTSPALAVQEDPLLEGSETVLLTLTNASGPATSLGDTANTTTITDNESATLSMAATSTVAEEGGAQAVGMVTLAITGTGAGAFALGKGVVMTADVSDVGTGSAAGGGVDYTFSTQTVTFDGGAADGTVQTGAALGVKLTPNNDILVEGNETVTFALGALSKPETVVATLAAVANLTTIDDNDTAAFSYATPAGVASEKEPNYVVPVVLTVTANGASGTGSLTVPVTLNWGVVPSGTTARPNVNYVPPPPGATVTFPAGADSSYVQAVSLIVKEDFIITPPMTVQLNLTLQTSLDGQLSSAPFATHVATIANSDTVMPKFEMPEPQPPAPLPVLRELSEAPRGS